MSVLFVFILWRNKGEGSTHFIYVIEVIVSTKIKESDFTAAVFHERLQTSLRRYTTVVKLEVNTSKILVFAKNEFNSLKP